VNTARIPAIPRGGRRPVAREPNPVIAWAGESLAAAAGALVRRPGATLVGLAILGCVGSVGWNLTMGQPGRHPAPLFNKAAEKAEPRPVQAAAAPLPVPRPDLTPVAPPLVDPPFAPATTQSTDRIGALLRSEPGRTTEAGRVAAAQRALTRLGYGPLKSDGMLGPETKTAIERFERDRKLQVTGLVAGRTSRLLSQQAGIVIE
jgi:hypothetical protein